MLPSLTCAVGETGLVEFAHVELQANDGEHEDGKEEEQPNLQEWDHGLHDGLEHHLQTWGRAGRAGQIRQQSGQNQEWPGSAKEQQELAWAGLKVLCKVPHSDTYRDKGQSWEPSKWGTEQGLGGSTKS